MCKLNTMTQAHSSFCKFKVEILTLVIAVLIVNMAGVMVRMLAGLVVVTVVIVICRFR